MVTTLKNNESCKKGKMKLLTYFVNLIETHFLFNIIIIIIYKQTIYFLLIYVGMHMLSTEI